MATTASGAAANLDPKNVYSFPKLNNNQLEPNHDHDNNNNHARARAREWQQVLEAYEDVLGRQMPRFVQAEVEGFLKDGVELSMIKAIIEYTACAPRPSWAYARTVLYRSVDKGMKSAVDFMNGLAMRGRAGDDVPW